MGHITYYASTSDMGDTTVREAEQFRSWSEQEIASAFPGYQVEVSSAEHWSQTKTDDEARRDEIEEFCARLWDRCPWEQF